MIQIAYGTGVGVGVARYMEGHVYVIEYEGAGVVKIGFTTNLTSRLNSLRQWLDTPSRQQPAMRLLTTFEGTAELERALHHHFRHRVCHGREGFDAAWVKAALPSLNLSEVLATYRSPHTWEDEVTEITPPGYHPTHPSPAELEEMCADADLWREEVARLRFPIGFVRQKNMLKRPLTDTEVSRLLAPLTMRDQAFMWCGLGGGLLPSEIPTLTIRDVSDHYVMVSGRRAHLSRQAYKVLAAHIRTLEDTSPESAVFPSRKGGALRGTSSFALIATRLAESKISAEPSSLRTTHMVGLYQQGTALEVIAKQTGYDSVAKLRPVLAAALL